MGEDPKLLGEVTDRGERQRQARLRAAWSGVLGSELWGPILISALSSQTSTTTSNWKRDSPLPFLLL